MGQLSVVALGPNQESCEALKSALQRTGLTQKIIRLTYPVAGEWLRDLAGAGVTVFAVDVPPQSPSAGLEAIVQLREYLAGARVIAIGDSHDARNIVDAMRAGASDFVDYTPQPGELARALLYKAPKSQARGKVFTFVNAKGGNGATTLAVNTALTFTDFAERVVLVDLATPGNAALHLNLSPKYTLRDISSNLHRLDIVLLEQLVAKHASGLDVLPGADEPVEYSDPEELSLLFDLLSSTYEYVIVDSSSRLDEVAREVCGFSDSVFMVAQADLASLWNAQRVRKYLARDASPEKVRLVLNRYKKVPGVSERDMEQASGCKLAWAFPNHFVSATNAITTGTPVTQTDSELAPAFVSFVEFLTGRERLRSRREEKRAGASIRERLSGLKAIAPLGFKASESA